MLFSSIRRDPTHKPGRTSPSPRGLSAAAPLGPQSSTRETRCLRNTAETKHLRFGDDFSTTLNSTSKPKNPLLNDTNVTVRFVILHIYTEIGLQRCLQSHLTEKIHLSCIFVRSEGLTVQRASSSSDVLSKFASMRGLQTPETTLLWQLASTPRALCNYTVAIKMIRPL